MTLFGYTQAEREIQFSTPLGDDAFVVTSFSGVEALSSLYVFELELVSEQHNVDFHQIIGQNVSLVIKVDGEKRLVFNGIVCRFSQSRGGGEEGSDTSFSYYRATMVPKLWLATQTKKIRKWQDATSADVINQILSEYGLTGSVSTSFTHDYVLQYNESDFNVIARLLEDEDMYFYFEQDESTKEQKFIAVKPPGSPKVVTTARYQLTGGGLDDNDLVTGLVVTEEIRPNEVKLADLVPTQTVDIVEGQDRAEQFPQALPVREYPGNIEGQDRSSLKAKIRLGTDQTIKKVIHGASNCMSFRSGERFTLTGYYRQDMDNQAFLLTTIQHQGSQSVDGQVSYSNSFTCIPSDILFRAPRTAYRPRVQGTQTAMVTDFPDEHGWIKVRVPWVGPSEWLEHPRARVTQPWAGAGYGAMFVPRPNHEVVLDFIDGDPHKPIVTGRVYNLTSEPGYPFTAWTKTTIKSESMSANGTAGSGSNEITFEDETGKEEIYIHAEKFLRIVAKNNMSTTGGANANVSLAGNRKTDIKGNDSVKIGGNRDVKIAGNDELDVTGNVKIKAGGQITIWASGQIHIKSDTKVLIEAPDVQIIGSGYAKVESGGATDVKGNPVKLNC